MNDYDLIAPFYDIEHAHFEEDLSLYKNFAEMCGSPLLELACGSGRLLVALARQGFELTGVDSSAVMLNLAKEAWNGLGVAKVCNLYREERSGVRLGKNSGWHFM